MHALNIKLIPIKNSVYINKGLLLDSNGIEIIKKHDEEEDKNAFECDDCNYKGINCYEQIGLTKEESIVYMDLGEPDRCEDCFNKWKSTIDAVDYLEQTEEEEDDRRFWTEIEKNDFIKKEEVEEEEEEEEKEEDDDEDDIEVEEVTIGEKNYYLEGDLKTNGTLYKVLEDEDIGEVVGRIYKGVVSYE